MTAEPFKPALRDRIADPGRITLPEDLVRLVDQLVGEAEPRAVWSCVSEREGGHRTASVRWVAVVGKWLVELDADFESPLEPSGRAAMGGGLAPEGVRQARALPLSTVTAVTLAEPCPWNPDRSVWEVRFTAGEVVRLGGGAFRAISTVGDPTQVVAAIREARG
ncbi:MAG TPA: hypothetical protein H9987_05760 [Candidatus Luteococcus avicola]|nr:hypothetical protein [Candidatus Luteococcus avicola]